MHTYSFDDSRLYDSVGEVVKIFMSQEKDYPNVQRINQDVGRIEVMANDIKYIQRDVIEIKETFKSALSNSVSRKEFDDALKEIDKKASKDEFEPIKKVVYGVVALILIAVFTAILSLVVRK